MYILQILQLIESEKTKDIANEIYKKIKLRKFPQQENPDIFGDKSFNHEFLEGFNIL